MNYNLNQPEEGQNNKKTTLPALRKLFRFMAGEKKAFYLALIAILANAGLNLAGPIIVGHTIDNYVQTKEYNGVLLFSGILLIMYLLALLSGYLQTKIMGGIGQRVLFSLRNAVFNKLQELPVAFFNQNKVGDLISRINNDTDKINQFFSQSLMQFIGSIFIMTGAGIFLLAINPLLGAVTLIPALLLFIFTRSISPWVKRKNAISLRTVGGLSAEIQESLQNFKVIIAFNRRDYFRARFNEVNNQTYDAAVGAGVANNTFMPVFGFCSNIAQLIVLALGIYLISTGHFTIGLLISFLAYTTNFYNPLRQLAAVWANFQVAMAGWDRISRILSLESDMQVIPVTDKITSGDVMEFRNVHFHYPNGKEVLHGVNLHLQEGKKYALVGPTGGGKSTTASLMARLYDPTKGMVLLNGKDIRSFSADERTQKVGFILQEPFLFAGTLRENILYGTNNYDHYSNEQLITVIRDAGLEGLLARFDDNLDMPVQATGEAISLGQKQLIAFMRAVLRNPQVLILDEATANIDTVTEQLLEQTLKMLPATTTLVIIAHRLNTIENADEIYFVNSGNIIPAGSLQDAMKMLLNQKRES